MSRITPEQIRASPVHFIAVSFQAFAVLFSIYSLYQLSRKTITSKSIRIFLIAALVGNIISQGFIFYRYNFDMGLYTLAILWILITGIAYTVVLVDFMILKCYQPLNDRITCTFIKGIRIGCTVLFLASHFLAVLFLFSVKVPDGEKLQDLLGGFFVLACMIYDNAQVCYLTYLVYSSKKKAADKRIVNETLKKTIQLNILVCGMDWIATALFFAQLFLPRSATPYILQQISTSCITIHVSLLILIFNRLKELTFAGMKRKAAPAIVPAQAIKPETIAAEPKDIKLEPEPDTVLIKS